MARFLFDLRFALRRHLGWGDGPKTKLEIEIVGVCEDSLYEGPREGVSDPGGCRPAIGIPAALVVSRYVATQLYGVKATDIASAAAALVILAVVAAGAGYLPARRASTIDPIQALRYV